MASIEQLPGSLSVTSKQGDDVTIPVVFRSGEPSAAMNLTGYTIEAHIFSVTGNIDLTVYSPDLSTGAVSFTLSKEQSSDLVGVYRWEVTWIDPGLKTRSVIEGTWEFVKNV